MNQPATVWQTLIRRVQNDDYRTVLGLLLLLAAVLILAGIGMRSPWPADEPRFAEVAREMVDFKQWLIPMRGGEFYPDKPPVFMWAIAFFYWLTGNLRLAFLLPNALCGLLTVWLVFDIGARLWNVRVARNAVLLLMLAPQFLLQSKNAQIDAMVACWITVGCYGLLRHFFTGPSWGWYFAGWAFMGLGIITKGVGFLPLLMFIPIGVLAFRDRSLFAGRLTWLCLAGPLMMILVAAAWLVPMVLYVDHHGTAELIQYRNNILFKQTGERYANSWGHIQPWYYFLKDVLPLHWFPLPFLLIASWKPLKERLPTNPAILVLLVWVALVILFFSISPGKRDVYILPALPMFALALSAIITGRSPARWFGVLVTGVQGLIAIALMVIGVLALRDFPKLVDKVSDYSTDPAQLHTLGLFVFGCGVWVGAVMIVLRRRAAMVRQFVALAGGCLLFSFIGYGLMEPLRTPQNVMTAVGKAAGPDGTVGIIEFSEQFILFSPIDVVQFGYYNSGIEQQRDAWRWLAEGPDRYVLASTKDDMPCFNKEGARSMGVAHSDIWLLYSSEQRKADCPAPTHPKRFHIPRPGRWLD
ncbi:MAG: glycosyltransferase family 39 protein [Marinobacter sp.]|nr:glycosyltransferase family 39 protein [Marinobacter sp.]